MTPTLIDAPYTEASLMDHGLFALFYAWDIQDGYTIEYWRGVDSNGSCLRTLRDGRMVSTTHYKEPGSAIRALRIGNYPIPGIPALTDEERGEQGKLHRRNLQSGHVHHRAAAECTRCGLLDGHRYPCTA